jgi:hypothetical protein
LILTLTTTLLLATSSYAFNDHGKACDRNNHGRWSYDQHHASNYTSQHCGFEKSEMNRADKITLDEFITLKRAKFSQMDTNGDGVLTQNEMRNHRQNYYNRGSRYCPRGVFKTLEQS